MDFEVSRTDLHTTRVVDSLAPVAGPGQAVLRIDHAALTANNITYGAFGDIMGYWSFFPTDDGWGRVPVWGFADVVESQAEGVVVGRRVYGYFPMSTHLLVEPAKVTAHGFVDGVAHRAPLPPVYNQYSFVEPSPAADEHRHAVLRPLFTTSFLIDDWLAEQSFFGAVSVVIASASSKTALALAESLQARGGVEVIGLTSERNRAFVEGVGWYDRTVVYGSVVESLDASTPTVFVDMGGDPTVQAEVHGHFAESLRASCSVGATHWDTLAQARSPLPGPAPALFFAPDQVRRRIADWGSVGFEERVEAAWGRFSAATAGWLTITEHRGPDAVVAAFADVRDGRIAPDQAVVVSLHP